MGQEDCGCRHPECAECFPKPDWNVTVGRIRIYRHKKGGLYRLICRATMKPNGERMVVYEAQDKRTYVRTLEDFKRNFKEVETYE